MQPVLDRLDDSSHDRSDRLDAAFSTKLEALPFPIIRPAYTPGHPAETPSRGGLLRIPSDRSVICGLTA
jgi:hypothetical protein